MKVIISSPLKDEDTKNIGKDIMKSLRVLGFSIPTKNITVRELNKK